MILFSGRIVSLKVCDRLCSFTVIQGEKSGRSQERTAIEVLKWLMSERVPRFMIVGSIGGVSFMIEVFVFAEYSRKTWFSEAFLGFVYFMGC